MNTPNAPIEKVVLKEIKEEYDYEEHRVTTKKDEDEEEE